MDFHSDSSRSKQHHTNFIVTVEPNSWSPVIHVVCDAYIVSPTSNNPVRYSNSLKGKNSDLKIVTSSSSTISTSPISGISSSSTDSPALCVSSKSGMSSCTGAPGGS